MNRAIPAPSDRRCDAMSTGTSVRCSLFANWFRGGRYVCHHHFNAPSVKYASGRGDRVGAYREMMAIALGDAS
jgi:hypothetical protein